MRTQLNKLKFLILILAVFISCSEIGDDPVFSTSASERATEGVNNMRTTLTSATEWWLFEFYPDKTQQYGGYNYIVSFDENSEVDVYSELQADFSTPETSTYDIIAKGGPVLTFDTYNSVMHEFSTPSAEEYQAKGGDYEFVLSNSNDENVLNAKGTITGNKLKLIKLNETPQAYLTKISDISYNISLASGVSINGEDRSVGLGNRHISFSSLEGGETDMAFIPTDTGIKLYESIVVDGHEVIEFTFNKTLNQLISLDENVVIDLIVAPFNINQYWVIDVSDLSNISTDFYNTYVDVYNANVTVYGEDLQKQIAFGNTSNGSGIMLFSLELPSQFWGAEYFLNFSPISGKPNQLAISKDGVGLNWSFYGHLDPLVDYIADNAPYTVEPNTPINPTEVKLISTVDLDAWFVIKL